ncbi:multidrug transporter subunit MdtD [Serratia marcescens]|nr:multidrug transporter subunit MdtD [Serratia marcescens]RTF20964.1 DHA2 family efflux MFS transporter permease subunit [Serratia marcescens]RTF52636.1 DHA2 family efflux MFS transporter permease subunit [Serratia marcescens]RTF66425.1 DHA2 family efflux MFS transporter permease subunit [Serratia marcescens]RTF76807.1 DHA2 family efflux MFS transporter permease subunit [Serratia marcescens]RTG31819.1 DHA2 family efflux MFS transporter permease subunit [Serratia marcescens]
MTQSARSMAGLPWIAAMAFFMQALDATILNTALPAIAQSLGRSPLAMQSAVISYTLTVAMLIPVSGWLADRFGTRRVFIFAVTLFTLGSLLCALSPTLSVLVASRVLQGIGGAMMMPVARLALLRAYPRSELLPVLNFVTMPGLVGPILGPLLGGWLVTYATWHWIFLINIPVGIVGAIATLLLMPNYQMQTRRFDLSGFILLAIGMASLTLALDGHKGMGLSVGAIAGLVALGAAALLGYVWHAYGNSRALFSLRLLRTPTYKIGLLASLLGRIGSGMLPFMTPLFLQVGMGFTPFHAGLMMIPMIIGSMGMKRIVVQVVNRFGYRNVLVAATLLLALVSLSFLLAAMLGWLWLLPVVLFFQGMINSLRFSAMNTLTLKDLPDRLASSGNSLLSMVMQLSMSLGVSVAGILIGSFAHHQVVADSPAIHSAFIYSYCCMALIIALPALAFARVPADSAPNRTLTKEPGTGSTRLQ